jgi:phosphatidylglycerol:prolipoprotein diacylglycerol transferase
VLTLLANAYVHRLDPVAIPISGDIAVRWYGLSYAAGFVITWLFVRWMARTGRSPMTVRQVGDFMFTIIVGILIGGRIGYAALYDPALFGFQGSVPFWRLLAIWQGGMASHGGIAGYIAASVVYARRHDLPAFHLIDLGAFTSGIGLSLGRLANFINGELWGKPLAPAVEASARDLVGGDETFLRNVVDGIRDGNAALIEAVRPHLTAYYPSQIIQAITDGPILVTLLALIWLKPRKPGVIGCWFLIIYGVLRIASEVFRQPDEGVPLLFGLSRGQVLSVIMVIAGAIILAIVVRRDVPRLGGLLKPGSAIRRA